MIYKVDNDGRANVIVSFEIKLFLHTQPNGTVLPYTRDTWIQGSGEAISRRGLVLLCMLSEIDTVTAVPP